jgi:hypothetical protein
MSKEKEKATQCGANSEGYLIRHDLILAIKTKTDHETHSLRVKNRTRQMSFNQEQAAENLKETMGGAGKVHSGYEENE